MKSDPVAFKEKKISIKELDHVDAKIVYHTCQGIDTNTLLVAFHEKRHVLSTVDGFRKVSYAGNSYIPPELEKLVMTLKGYKRYEKQLPQSLGIKPGQITFMSTGVNMDDLAISQETYKHLKVCCIATAGAKHNALRMGTDTGDWVEAKTNFELSTGTINTLLLTNTALTTGAMARAIMTATEAKTAALQDLNYMSTSTPQVQATGTGTDTMIIVSGIDQQNTIHYTGGHTKMGELIAKATKTAVIQGLKNFEKTSLLAKNKF
ncbi:MAG: adenosylcobinamide amidohydrolase [Nitrososphaerota archaeon]|jgi:adenosylcobinamide amidohydrolase|nr:adenosylcobinamide amidohydrolase [Nitrososphaerota archaeon]